MCEKKGSQYNINIVSLCLKRKVVGGDDRVEI